MLETQDYTVTSAVVVSAECNAHRVITSVLCWHMLVSYITVKLTACEI